MLIDEIQSEFLKLERDMRNGPLYPEVTAPEIRNHLTLHYDFSRPLYLEDIAADVCEMMRRWNVQITHPRYLGLFNPSVTFASVLADVIVAMHNPQLATWRTAPAANEIERHTLGWLASKFGLPGNTLGMFTTGGAEANLSAVIAALTKAFPEYAEKGLRSVDCEPVIYLSTEAHHSFSKIAHMTGLGRDCIRVVGTDNRYRLDLRELEAQISDDLGGGRRPLMVVGTCGSTAAGIIDPLEELGQLCSAHSIWFHVDAAWGGAAVLSPKLRPHLAGIESADSITCDAHKWLSVPMGCGMFFCRHPEIVSQSFRAQAAYMPAGAADDTYDPYTHSVQWSRRFSGLKLFMSLAQHGEKGYATMIDRQTHMGEMLRNCLLSSGWSVLNDTPLPLVCFTREGLDTTAFLRAMRERQIAWISEARVGGHPVLRACITSFRTTKRDVQWVVEQMNQLIHNFPSTVAMTA